MAEEQLIGTLRESPSLDIALDLARERAASQVGAIDALDAKANFILTSASVVVSTSIAVNAVIGSTAGSDRVTRIIRVLSLVVVIVIYLGVVGAVYLAYKTRDYDRAPTPRKLVDDCLYWPVDETKEAVLRALSSTFDTNAKKIDKKARWVNWALLCLVIQSVILGVGILLQTFV